MEKPDVLSEKQQENVYIPCEGCELTRDMLSVTCVQCCVGHLLQAQRDDTYTRTRQGTAREISERIEKVETEQFTRIPPEYDRGYSNGFHDATQKILSLLRKQ